MVIAALEAGGGPAISFYFTMLYPRNEFGLRWAIFQASSCISNAMAGAMAYGLVQAKSSLTPWRLVFIVESAVSSYPPHTLTAADIPLWPHDLLLDPQWAGQVYLPHCPREGDRARARTKRRYRRKARLHPSTCVPRIKRTMDLVDRLDPLLWRGSFQFVSVGLNQLIPSACPYSLLPLYETWDTLPSMPKGYLRHLTSSHIWCPSYAPTSRIVTPFVAGTSPPGRVSVPSAT